MKQEMRMEQTPTKTKRSLLIGERVRIHPACDWFMRGATYGTITKKHENFAWVKLENIGPSRLRARIPYDLLCLANESFPEERTI